MRLSQLLNPDAIRLRLKSRAKREVLAELVDLLESSHGFASQGEILDRVLRREAMMSTGLFPGAAIPHGKARSVDRMAAACGLSPEGVDFDSEDGAPTHLFVLLVSPENATTPHVRLLANISRLLKDDGVRQGLLSARSPEEFLAVVEGGESAFASPG
jgi:mannitol/fructose-specific phosphotransferase system IIA component (Ntr-type)